jgi:arylsulfatase A-like enzyme
MSWYDDALIIVLSDHGEEFWEHIPEHSPEHNHSVFDELLHVPLIVKFPGGAHAGLEVQSTVRLIDVAPTILEVAGIPLEKLLPRGVSLIPFLNSGKKGENLELFAGYTQMGPMRYAVRTADFKYIYAPQTVAFEPFFTVPQEALYDLKNDPKELDNLVTERPRVVEEMRAKLRGYRENDLPFDLVLDDSPMGLANKKYLKALGFEGYLKKIKKRWKPTTRIPEIDKRHMKQLRSLGYMK